MRNFSFHLISFNFQLSKLFQNFFPEKLRTSVNNGRVGRNNRPNNVHVNEKDTFYLSLLWSHLYIYKRAQNHHCHISWWAITVWAASWLGWSSLLKRAHFAIKRKNWLFEREWIPSNFLAGRSAVATLKKIVREWHSIFFGICATSAPYIAAANNSGGKKWRKWKGFRWRGSPLF